MCVVGWFRMCMYVLWVVILVCTHVVGWFWMCVYVCTCVHVYVCGDIIHIILVDITYLL